LRRSPRALRDPTYGRFTTASPTAARVDVSVFHDMELAVSVVDDSTRSNGGSGVGALTNTNIQEAVLHVTLAPRVLWVTPTDEDGGYALWE
jgi:hypothetical protein